jgi:hypothetical protein
MDDELFRSCTLCAARWRDADGCRIRLSQSARRGAADPGSCPIAIGWLSLLIFGALIQFVPVLVARQLAYPELPVVALELLIAGLAGLIVSFLGMAGFAVGLIPWLPLGAIALTAGFSINIWNLGRTMWSARPIGPPARFVSVGLVSLIGAALFGSIFSVTLNGWTANVIFLRLTSQGIPLHAALGLGGWLTFTAMGVSYRLLAMFMLAPEAERPTSRFAFVFGTAAVMVLLIGGPACLLIVGQELTLPLLAALALATLSVGLYSHDIARLYRGRKRRKVELNMRMAMWALAGLGLTNVLFLILIVLEPIDQRIGAVVFLLVFGWLTGLGLAKLYKIVAFLTWLECYGALLGKGPTPRVQDLVNEPRATPWFWLYFSSVAAASIAAFLDVPLVFRAAAFGMLIASAKISIELISIRTLRSVPAPTLPQATTHGHGCLCQTRNIHEDEGVTK